MTELTLTPARLWRRMTGEQRLKAARAFWQDEEAADDQVQAALLIAQHKKFRAKTVISLDDERKARHLATLPVLPEAVAARALIIYHLTEQRPMMGTFLDALGIPHDDGVIQQDDVTPDAAKIGPAAQQISKAFAPADVSLYLNTLLCQDPATWGALQEIVERLEVRG